VTDAAAALDVKRAEPVDGHQARTAYGVISGFAYLLYGIGALGPFLRSDLHASDVEIGLNASATAIGLLVAGFVADRAAARIGAASTLLVAVAGVGLAGVLVAVAPAIPFVLAAALLLGVTGGIVLGTVNAALAHGGGPDARQRITLANMWAILAALAAPIVVGVLASTPVSWRAGLLVPLVALALIGPGRIRRLGGRSQGHIQGEARLTHDYWRAWLFVFLCVGVEFSFVYWSGLLLQARAGVAPAVATTVASAFVLGMLVGRSGLGVGIAGAVSVPLLLRASLVLVAAGWLLTWLSSETLLSGLGLLVAGVGVAGLYPIGVARAIEAAPGAPLQAGSRLTLASGGAILLAPLILGAISQAIGVASGWPAIAAMIAGAVIVLGR
jgi:fucose permease